LLIGAEGGIKKLIEVECIRTNSNVKKYEDVMYFRVQKD
jgi:hypothetical protein